MEFNSEDINEEDDFAVIQKRVRTLVRFEVVYSELVSIVEELFNKRVKAEFLELP